jgi:hypothetical protein
VISAFGPKAQAHAATLGDLAAVIADPEHVIDAYLEAVRRRERGGTFYGMLLIDEPRAYTLETVAPAIFAKWPGFDERRAVLDQYGAGEAILNGRPAREAFVSLDPAFRQCAAEFFLLSNALLVRSFTEYARVSQLCPRPRPFERVVAVPAIGRVVRRRPQRPSVVVWATAAPAEASALYAFALSEFLGDVTYVVGAGAIPSGFPGTFVRADDPRVVEALGAATAVVVTDAADPGPAIAFARLGYGVVAPLSSGAHEYVREIATFDPGYARTLHIAVAAAIGRPASLRELPAPPPSAPALPEVPDLPAGAPLVSVVIATYNRRADIERCLEGLAAQTYPNLEVVIVNDGGEPIDDIVSRFRFATLVNLEQNLGGMKAGIAGMKFAHGEFAQWMADDDWLYPDHFTRLVSALVTSGASIAHTNGLIRHQRRLPDGALETSGFNAGVFIDSTTPSDALIATAIVLISILFRRSVFDEIGPPIDIVIADYEIQVRASERYAFAYVDQTTVEWRLRGESHFAGMDSPAAMRYVFEVLYPRPQRPMIEQNRASTISNVASRPAGQPMFPPTVLVSYKPV